MAFKIPSKRRRDSSLTGSQGSRLRTSAPASAASRSSAAPSQSSRHFARTPRHNGPQQVPASRAPSASSRRPAASDPRSRASSPAPSGAAIEAEDEIAIHEREDNDSLNEVVMALDLRNTDTVGCSFYFAKKETLYLMGDIKFGGLDIVDTLKLHIQPTVVLLSSRVDDALYENMDPEHRARDSINDKGGFFHKDIQTDQFRLPYIIDIRSSPEFNYEAGKRKLVDIRTLKRARSLADFVVPGEDTSYEEYGEGYETGFTRHQGKLLRLSGSIDLESQISVGCAGAVLTYLQRRRAVQYLPGDEDAARSFQISAIEMFTLDGIMLVNADTLASLQIMQSESHPHSHNQGPTKATSGSKEGLSIYGLFHHLAKTPQGKYLLRQYFLRPTLDLEIITERQNTASVFLRPDNDGYMNELVKSLKQIKNMRTVMIHLQKGMSNALTKGGGIKSGVWMSLRSFAFYTMGIRRVFTEIMGAEQLEIRNKVWTLKKRGFLCRLTASKVLEGFESHQLASLGRIVTQIVDFKSSAEVHRTVVLPGVDDELDEVKRTYEGIESLLNQTSKDIANSIPNQFSLDLNVIFFPQIGFLICMPIDPISGRAEYEGGDDENQRWERIFSTSNRVYYKDARMQELDETFGDLYQVICDKEIEIIHGLATEALKFEAMLCQVSDICGELDCLLALAQGAKMYKLTRPKVSTENIIDIKGGRHLLQEQVVPSYVANDCLLVGGSPAALEQANPRDGTELGEDSSRQASVSTQEAPEGPSLLLLTGPNFSGKSVYLKQVALIVYMAHIGCFVPADRAIVGLTDKILTRIATRETVSRIQSAFMIDLQQISSAINMATNRTLLIIDEFGKGTDAADGAGLACGVFEHLLSLGDGRPKVLGATHFHEIFENGFLQPRPGLEFGHMEVRLDERTADMEDQVSYLYNFRLGRSAQSFGTICAALNGISEGVIERAEELITLGARGKDMVTACASVESDESEDFKEAEAIATRLLHQNLGKPGEDRCVAAEDFDPRAFLDRLL
ncbi:MutS protein msh5 [Trapelia coarctata]|nr:MutS protein msh5 [Trapelia coarctata]